MIVPVSLDLIHHNCIKPINEIYALTFIHYYNDYLFLFFSIAAEINDLKIGCALFGLDLNSGWN